MSLDHSRKLIHDIVTTREAEDYIEGLLKDPEMRADMERAASKWDVLMNERGTIAPEPSMSEVEKER